MWLLNILVFTTLDKSAQDCPKQYPNARNNIHYFNVEGGRIFSVCCYTISRSATGFLRYLSGLLQANKSCSESVNSKIPHPLLRTDFTPRCGIQCVCLFFEEKMATVSLAHVLGTSSGALFFRYFPVTPAVFHCDLGSFFLDSIFFCVRLFFHDHLLAHQSPIVISRRFLINTRT